MLIDLGPFVCRHRTLAAFAGVFVVLLLSGRVIHAQPPRPTPSPRASKLPLDPLAPEETGFAERIALEDGRVKELLGRGPHRLISVELLFLKPEREEYAAPSRPVNLGRYAEVIFRRQEDESGVRAVVDLIGQSVTMASRLESAQVPLNPEDLAEAAKLALENDEFRRALGPDLEGFAAAARSRGTSHDIYAVTGLRLLAAVEDDACYTHRCMRLMFRRGRNYLGQPIVWVDVTARQVHVEGKEP